MTIFKREGFPWAFALEFTHMQFNDIYDQIKRYIYR